MSRDLVDNLSFYETKASAEDYLRHRVTQGEQLMCDRLRNQRGPLLEIGCGAGRLYEAFGDDAIDWVGLDYAATPLRILSKHHPSTRVVQGDAAELPFADGEFGAALLGYHMIESILSTERRERALAEARRVVRDDGLVVLTRHLRWSYHPAAQMLAYARRRVRAYGDLVGPARDGTGGEFRMHVLSSREMRRGAERAGLVRRECWDFHTCAPVGVRSVAVVEVYGAEPSR